MATSLGWRDVGTVLLSKADAERRKGDEQRGDDGRDAPVFQGAVMSRRQHRPTRGVDNRAEREETSALVTDLHEVLGKKPENRLKWLQHALLLAGKKKVKVGVVYDIVTHKKFVAEVRAGVGAQMKALLHANLHLFSPKQQKFLQSDSNGFGEFPDAAPLVFKDRGSGWPCHPPSAAKAESSRASTASSVIAGAESAEDRCAGTEGDRAKRRKTSVEDGGTGASSPTNDNNCSTEGRKPRRLDPRIFSRGAADEPSDEADD
mmetsp:Transcript_63541/g.148187  ORF Transcript_63541/g.148187 Transcript_63541/m.148187 type:complete len:261 (-) Transcript_63541:141-923(-)|eukprot:CAMPEP_0171058638 /NCGR_PEP_ID=MMETSP0766_2-20121228/2629_1 /TAXON_ID=439317 /ORGANISM="Gambierdiscus australes, Strain CAWD 149" /LENGTH=260 /DNA_ID=CAMNT_0011513943 /DNA_START=104 /DNA_END=886 /DNA_ORIENTATION=+